jgi:hypothetical protein
MKRVLVEQGRMGDKCRNARNVNGRTGMLKNINLAGGGQMGSKAYMESEDKSSVSPNTHPHRSHKFKQYLREIPKVGFNFIAK